MRLVEALEELGADVGAPLESSAVEMSEDILEPPVSPDLTVQMNRAERVCEGEVETEGSEQEGVRRQQNTSNSALEARLNSLEASINGRVLETRGCECSLHSDIGLFSHRHRHFERVASGVLLCVSTFFRESILDDMPPDCRALYTEAMFRSFFRWGLTLFYSASEAVLHGLLIPLLRDTPHERPRVEALCRQLLALGFGRRELVAFTNQTLTFLTSASRASPVPLSELPIGRDISDNSAVNPSPSSQSAFTVKWYGFYWRKEDIYADPNHCDVHMEQLFAQTLRMPLSLQQLARICVRVTLGGHHLESRVRSLRLPPLLRDYVLYADEMFDVVDEQSPVHNLQREITFQTHALNIANVA